jgi:hypothetical protein
MWKNRPSALSSKESDYSRGEEMDKKTPEILDQVDESNLDPSRIIHLLDESGESMPVEVIVEFEVDGNTYALTTPAQPVVYILREDMVDDDAPLEAVYAEDFPSIAKYIQASLSKHNLKVEVNAGEFVMSGEASDEFYHESEVMEVETEDGEMEYAVLIEVEDAESRYLVCEPLDPVIYPTEVLPEEKARLLNDEEIQRFEGIFHEMLTGGDV